MRQLVRTDNGDGVLIEVEAREIQEVRAAAGEVTRTIGRSFSSIADTLKTITKPFVETWKELSKDVSIEEAKITLSVGMTAEGNFYVVKGEANANFEIELTMRPVEKHA